MRKPAFCTCENEDADQLRGNPVVWDLVGNPEDRFSHNEALILMMWRLHLVINCHINSIWKSGLK